MKRNIKSPYIECIGQSCYDVTGSSYLLKFLNYTGLIEYGLFQSNRLLEDYKINKEKPKSLKPKEIDFILVGQIHADHSCKIPSLYALGCIAPIYVPLGSKDLLKLLWEDSAKIMEQDAEKINKLHGIKANSLYSLEEIQCALSHIIEVPVGETFHINKYISFRFYEANHVLHACQISINLFDGIKTTVVNYTSDIGSLNISRPYLKSFESLPKCQVMIGEATYAAKGRNHKLKDRDKDIEKIKSVIQEAVENKSRVLFPTFSFDRLETLLTILYQVYDGNCPLPIIVDTPLGGKIASIWDVNLGCDGELWDKVYHWSNVKWVSDWNLSTSFHNDKTPRIVISTSGMLSSGRSLSYLKYMLPNPKDTIIFCGYSAEETLATKIKKGEEKYLKLEGKLYKNECRIVNLNSFSCHACHDELIEYYTSVRYNKLYLVHSNQNDKIEFAKELNEALSKLNKTSKVIATNLGTKIYL